MATLRSLSLLLITLANADKSLGQSLHTDCQDVYNDGYIDNDVYSILPSWSDSTVDVFCNMSDGGGWTVFQRRVDGTVDFFRNWKSYKDGFGDLRHEFWLGNEKLYRLTNHADYELRIDLVNSLGDPYYAKYDHFRINDENDYYRLSGLGEYTGDAVNWTHPDEAGMKPHLHETFKTYDSENNDSIYPSGCASWMEGSWWFNRYCGNGNLNGPYPHYIFWNHLPHGEKYITNNILFTEMSVRRKQHWSKNDT